MGKATIHNYARMCRKYRLILNCTGCPLKSNNTKKDLCCMDFIAEFPSEANEIILNWCKEHPVTTRRDKLLEMFPSVPLLENGIPDLCQLRIDETYKECRDKRCEDCFKDYWLEEVDE